MPALNTTGDGVFVLYFVRFALSLSHEPKIKKGEIMARPIKETPILFGEDARRFVERMNQVRRETPEERERRLANFELAMKMLDLGERTKKKSICV